MDLLHSIENRELVPVVNKGDTGVFSTFFKDTSDKAKLDARYTRKVPEQAAGSTPVSFSQLARRRTWQILKVEEGWKADAVLLHFPFRLAFQSD